MVTANNLIAKGYFPAELVPAFNTESLGSALGVLIPYLTGQQRTSKTANHSIPRLKYSRRILGLPNPLHQIQLSQCIETSWTEIDAYINQANMSLSKPIIDTSSRRALSRAHSLGVLPEECTLRSSSCRYLLRTDIVNYYGSIYSHSIPWALHSKPVAKRNHGSSLYGNVIDTHIRNTQDGQTIGIPIGPDSSLVIGEIIGTAMDQELRSAISDLRGVRYIDDIYLFFDNFSQAECGLAKIQQIANHFELEINHSKTAIIPLPEPLKSLWSSELSQFKIRNTGVGQRSDLMNYFSKAFSFSQTCPDDFVLKYAISKIKSVHISPDNWALYESLLLQSAVAEPSVLQTIVSIFSAYATENYNLDTVKISAAISAIISYHAPLGHGFEVAWAIWLSKTLRLPISNLPITQISEMDDPIVALTALDVHSMGLAPGLNTTHWQTFMDSCELYDENWLLAYEANIKGWLSFVPSADFVASDPFFSVLKTNNVSFYDPDRHTPTVTLGAIPTTPVTPAAPSTPFGNVYFGSGLEAFI